MLVKFNRDIDLQGKRFTAGKHAVDKEITDGDYFKGLCKEGHVEILQGDDSEADEFNMNDIENQKNNQNQQQNQVDALLRREADVARMRQEDDAKQVELDAQKGKSDVKFDNKTDVKTDIKK